MKDKFILFGGLGIAVLCVASWILLPLYRERGYVRLPLWPPPELPIGPGYDLMSKEDIERLSKDPAQREIIEGMKNLPRSYRAAPIWLGNRYGPPRNPLAAVALIAIGVYAALLRYRGVV